MLRTLFAIAAGFFGAEIVITLVELASAKLVFPPPSGLDFADTAAVNAFVSSMPISALLMVLSGWLLGALTGSFITARIAVRHQLPAALLIGAFIVVGTLVNATQISHPAWMVAAGVALPIPLAWLGARLAQKGLASTR